MKNSFNGDGQGSKAFIVIWKLSCCSNAVLKDKSEPKLLYATCSKWQIELQRIAVQKYE